MLSNENFNEERFVISLGYLRFLNKPNKGFFLGGDISNSYSTYSIEQEENPVKKETLKIGMRVGYTFYPIKKLPQLQLSWWLSPRVALNSEDVVRYRNSKRSSI